MVRSSVCVGDVENVHAMHKACTEHEKTPYRPKKQRQKFYGLFSFLIPVR
jgi:hypothetical protein